MTNKINGIDVSECKWFIPVVLKYFLKDDCMLKERGIINKCKINNQFYGQEFYCEDNPDCYFKQLKRLQEENEKLREEKDEIRRILNE